MKRAPRSPRSLRPRLSVTDRARSGCDRAFLGRVVAATLAFAERPELAVPSVVYALTMNFGALGFLWLLRHRRVAGLALP